MLKSLVPLLGPDDGIAPLGRKPRSRGPYFRDSAAAGSAGRARFNSGSGSNLADEDEPERERRRAKTRKICATWDGFAIGEFGEL